MNIVAEGMSNLKTLFEWLRRKLSAYLFRGDSSQLPCFFSLIRPPEAFISVQLEKRGPRDRMLNTFTQKREALGSGLQSPVSTSGGSLAFSRETVGFWHTGEVVALSQHCSYSVVTLGRKVSWWQVWKPWWREGGWDVARACRSGAGPQMVAQLHQQQQETQGNLLPLRHPPCARLVALKCMESSSNLQTCG